MNPAAIQSIASALSGIASAANNAVNIYQSITGTGGTAAVVKALDQLDQDVKTGFQNVVNAINDQTLIQAWQPYQASLLYIYNDTTNYLNELSTLSLASSGPNKGQYTVISESEEVLFSDWCTKGTTSRTAMLTTLPSYIESANIGPAPGVPSLSGMFTELISNNNVLDVWVDIATAAQTSQLSLLSQYFNRSVYHLTEALMSEIYTILGMIYYVHDASLKMLNSILGEPAPFVSLNADIATYFGNSSGSGVVWSIFANKLEQIAQNPVIAGVSGANPIGATGQLLQCAFGPATYPGNQPTTGYQFSPSYVTNTYTVADAGLPANSFFTSLQINSLPNPGGGLPCYTTVIYLSASAATIGPGLVLTEANGGDQMPNGNAYMDGWNMECVTPANCTWCYFPMNQTPSNVNNLYVEVSNTTPLTNNQSNVITGFGFTTDAGGNLALTLQFGVLDVSDLNNPTVSIPDQSFQNPGTSSAGGTTFDFPGGIYLCPSGFFYPEEGQPQNGNGTMTNATLSSINGNLSICVQMAPNYYTADFLQPTNFPQIV